jgi:RNA polymerase sigma-70 factor (sigma-E family)
MSLDETLAELMTESGDRLLRLAYQLTHDRSAAEDVVQEALMNVYRSWRRRAPAVANVEGYARRAVVNEFLRRRRLRSSTELVTSAPPEVGAASFEDSVVDRDVVWRALGTLPARQRAVLVLRYYEELPDARIAELIGAREATVRSLAARALTALRGASLAFNGDPA